MRKARHEIRRKARHDIRHGARHEIRHGVCGHQEAVAPPQELLGGGASVSSTDTQVEAKRDAAPVACMLESVRYF